MRRWTNSTKTRKPFSSKLKRRLAAVGQHGALRFVEALEQRCLLTAIPTTIDLAPSQSPIALGAPVTLTATVHASPIPSGGTVTFLEGAAVLGTASVASGVAQLDNLTFPIGTHLLSAAYRDPSGA